MFFRWGQMAFAEWDSNSSSPWLWRRRPWALVLPDGTILTGTPPPLSDSHIPYHSTGNQCSGNLATICPILDVPASDIRSWGHTRIIHHDEIGMSWAEIRRRKGTVMRKCWSRSGEEGVFVWMLPQELWCKTLTEPYNKCLLFPLYVCHLPR